MSVDLIIKNIGKLVTMRGEESPRVNKQMNDLEIIENAYIGIKNGEIYEVGSGHDYTKIVNASTNIDDAEGLLMTPGLIDAHTHLIHGGSRENEFYKKLSGVPYIEILNNGGGILSTVQATRNSSFEDLYNKANKSLNRMLEFGVTTIESKSGYGLDLNTEVKQLEVGRELNKNHPIDLVHTFLGAHAIPKEYKDNKRLYIKKIVNEIMPIVKYNDLAEFCDIFCEDGAFNVDESEYMLRIAKKMGFKLKIHADEIVCLGGAELASRVGCISADHLMKASDEGLKSIADNKVIANLLPGTSFNLNKEYANARKMIDLNIPVSLSSDYNPGSCPSENLQFIMQLGCLHLNMTPHEVLTAVTINAAYAIDRQHCIGSIEVGKKADFALFDVPNVEYLMYHFGINHIDRVYKEGKLVVSNKSAQY